MNLEVLTVIQLILVVIVAGLFVSISYKMSQLETAVSQSEKDPDWLYNAMKKACANAIKEYDEGEDPPPPVTEELEVIVEQTPKKKRK